MKLARLIFVILIFLEISVAKAGPSITKCYPSLEAILDENNILKVESFPVLETAITDPKLRLDEAVKDNDALIGPIANSSGQVFYVSKKSVAVARAHPGMLGGGRNYVYYDIFNDHQVLTLRILSEEGFFPRPNRQIVDISFSPSDQLLVTTAEVHFLDGIPKNLRTHVLELPKL